MKIFIGFTLLILTLVATASFQSVDSIEWDESRKLTYSDFLDVFNRKNNKYGAQSYTSFDYTERFISKDSIWIKVFAKFNRYDSWYNPKDTFYFTLPHEQLHFDISELYAREFRKSISILNDSMTYKQIIDWLVVNKKTWLNKWATCQLKLDSDLAKVGFEDIQNKWNDSITLELKKMEEFKFKEIYLKLRK